MPISTKNIERQSPIGVFARHPLVILPPNLVTFWAASTAATSYTNGAALAAIPGRTVVSSSIGPCNMCFQVTAGAGFDSTRSILFEIDALDENYEPVRENFVIVGNGGATQNFYTQSLYSFIRGIRYTTPAPGNAAAVGFNGSGASLSCGTGDGGAAPANFLVQNPAPTLPLGAITFLPQGSGGAWPSALAAGSYVVPNALFLPDGRGGFRALRVSANYGATLNQARPAFVVYNNQDNYSIES